MNPTPSWTTTGPLVDLEVLVDLVDPRGPRGPQPWTWQWTSGPVDQWTSGPVDQPEWTQDQWTSGPRKTSDSLTDPDYD